MNYTIDEIEHHLEVHREILVFIQSKIPVKKVVNDYDREEIFTLDEVRIDTDGTVSAVYSRFAGCGEYDYHTDHLKVRNLLKERA